MSTCRGVWRDESVPYSTGVLMTVGGADPFVDHHGELGRCATNCPHHMSTCKEFEPVRSGFEPPAEPTSTMPRYLSMPFDWDPIFLRLEAGESMYSILKDYTHLRVRLKTNKNHK